MFPTLKKTIAAVAFVIAFAVVASPLNYLPPASQVIGYLNVSTLLKHPEFQQVIPMLNEEIKNEGISVADFDGKLALGIDFESKANKMQANVNFALELKRPTAKKIFESIAKENPKAKFTLKGKPAWQEGDGRIILFSDRVLIAQIHVEGKKTFLDYSNGSFLQKEAPQLELFDAAAVANVPDILANVGEIEGGAKEFFSKIKVAALFLKNQNNNNLDVLLSLEFKSAQDADQMAPFLDQMIENFKKENPTAQFLLNKITRNKQGKTLFFRIQLNNNEILKIKQTIKAE